MVASLRSARFIFIYILLQACSKGHFGNNCNDTCDGCISELCSSSDGVCDIQILCKAGLQGVSVTKVHVIYYINIVEKVGNVLINLKTKKDIKARSRMQSEDRHLKYTYICLLTPMI